MLTTESKLADQLPETRRDGALFRTPIAEILREASLEADTHGLARVLELFGRLQKCTLRPPVQDQVFVDNNSGITFIEKYVAASVRVLQDCFDPEAQLRQSVHWQDLGPLNGEVFVHAIPEFRSTAIGGAIAHYLGELALNGARAQLNGQEVVFSKLPTIFIANAAPRNGSPMEQGAPFIYARLGFNIFYFGTNSEELGYLKDFLIGNPREIVIDECTTYRSRFLGKRVAEWRDGDTSHFGKEIDASLITAAPRGAILFVDNFGNVKLNLTGRELEKIVGPLDQISEEKPLHANLRIGEGKSLTAQVVRKLEDGENGALLIAVGSSRANLGNELLDNSVDLYLKCNPQGRSAASVILDALGLPTSPGTPRHLLPLPGYVVQIEQKL